MGVINPSKMPKKKVIRRTDNPDSVDMYASGGTVRGPRGPGAPDDADAPGGPKGPGNPAGKYSTLLPKQLQSMKSKAQNLGLTKDVQDITEEEGLRSRLTGYADGGDVWDKPNPAKKHKKLSPAKKAAAKASAKRAGRPYPNLVDNLRALKKLGK